jgi:hypothetical protein
MIGSVRAVGFTTGRFENLRAGDGQHADRCAITEVGAEVCGGEGLLQQAAPAPSDAS